MIKRLLAAGFGGVVFAIITPITYLLIFDRFPLEGVVSSIALLAGIGFAIGALLGARFPKVFGFLFEMIFDI